MKFLPPLARFAHRRRVALLVLFGLSGVGAAIFGAGAHRVLEAGGFADPNSESSRAERMLRESGLGPPDVVVAYSLPPSNFSDPELSGRLQRVLEKLQTQPEVARINPPLFSDDKTFAVVSFQLRGDFHAVEKVLRAPGMTSWIGGAVPAQQQAQRAAANDLERGELIALPLVAILLVIFFRGFVLASLPLLIGGFAIASALACLRGLAHVTDVSIFAMNIATFVGFGVAVDYSLFVTTRFRDELHSGLGVADALERTVDTAGRTVVSSGTAVAVSLLGILVFPIPLLRSVAIAGTIVVAMAVLATLVFLPALLAVLGPRIQRAVARTEQEPADSRLWGRAAAAVMKAPLTIAIATTALLLLLGAPFLRMKESVGGASVLPHDAEARRVAELLDSHHFSSNVVTPIEIALDGMPPPSYVAELAKLPHVVRVLPIGPSVRVFSSVRPDSDEASTLVRWIRGIRPGEDLQALVGGRAAMLVDLRASLDRHLPWALGLICLVTFVVLFAVFRSVVVPIKAIVMNVLSLTASFGALVFIFQDGRFEEALNYQSPGSIELTIPVMMFAVVFGLAMDYELFLLSRIREAWDRTGDGRTSVAVGLEQTGRIITRAALLVIAVMVGFMSADMLLIKELGVGMAVAIAVDATIVRALLVPSTMELLGRYNWWSPQWLLDLMGRRAS